MFQILEKGFDAVFIATGAGAQVFLGTPGENLGGIFSANEYLTRSYLMKGYFYPEYDTPMPKSKSVAVFGGGNVAMGTGREAAKSIHTFIMSQGS